MIWHVKFEWESEPCGMQSQKFPFYIRILHSEPYWKIGKQSEKLLALCSLPLTLWGLRVYFSKRPNPPSLITCIHSRQQSKLSVFIPDFIILMYCGIWDVHRKLQALLLRADSSTVGRLEFTLWLWLFQPHLMFSPDHLISQILTSQFGGVVYPFNIYYVYITDKHAVPAIVKFSGHFSNQWW